MYRANLKKTNLETRPYFSLYLRSTRHWESEDSVAELETNTSDFGENRDCYLWMTGFRYWKMLWINSLVEHVRRALFILDFFYLVDAVVCVECSCSVCMWLNNIVHICNLKELWIKEKSKWTSKALIEFVINGLQNKSEGSFACELTSI